MKLFVAYTDAVLHILQKLNMSLSRYFSSLLHYRKIYVKQVNSDGAVNFFQKAA